MAFLRRLTSAGFWPLAMKSYACHFGEQSIVRGRGKQCLSSPEERARVSVAADHFSLAAAVYFAASVEPYTRFQ